MSRFFHQRSIDLALSLFPVFALLASVSVSLAQDSSFSLHTFDRIQLTDDYYSEGISAGDIDGDGVMDAVYGPFWFKGPDFAERFIIYPSLPQPRERYSNKFFAWVYDFNNDNRPDVFTVGFPGKPAHVYENPGPAGRGEKWKEHEVFDWVSNESPHFVDLVGDERPELVCARDGYFGYATVNWDRPFEPWMFHPVSERVAHKQFGHGLGAGDLSGDSRADIITKDGWFEQPSDNRSGHWKFHPVPFTARGGAEMRVYDVDGDGDNDVITSLAAHEYGLAWFAQEEAEGKRVFKKHLIMGHRESHNRYGVVFSELHSVNLADMDGDGLKDIVTGKTYWSHHKRSPGWDAGAVVYWFKLVRTADGVDWIPFKADGEAGIGRQVSVFDINGDGAPDILTGGMKGGHVLVHQRKTVDRKTWAEAQPRPARMESVLSGPPAPIDPASGVVQGAIEGEMLKARVSAGEVRPQDMKNFKAAKWSGGAQIFWTGAKAGDKLTTELTVEKEGAYNLEVVLTRAMDYGVVQFLVDGKKLGRPIDLYDYPNVTTTGVLKLDAGKLSAGKHELTVEITGNNPNGIRNHMVGVDYIKLDLQE